MAVDISPKQDGGVLKEIIREGVGEETPPPRSNVKVHYVGTLMDGTKIDSSRDRNEPLTFVLKTKSVIKAWDIGVSTMKKGEIAIFTCAPKYAYGAIGSPPDVPPDATLKFEIEMIDWTEEDLSPDKDGSITRHQIVKGKCGFPEEDSLVSIHITGLYEGKVFEDRDVEFVLNEGEAYGIVEGVEKALQKFSPGEKSKLRIKSKYAFKNEGNPEFGIPPDATVEYVVELKQFEEQEIWSLKGDALIERAKTNKEKGTNYFKENRYSLAIKMYKKCVSLLCSANEDDFKDMVNEKNSVLLAAYLNLGLCYLKTDQNVEAKDNCNKALELSPQNTKALFRRGQAYLALASPEVAIKDFQKVLEIEPKNAAAAKQISVCNSLIGKQLAKEKKLYANMFEKFAQQDKQKEDEKLRDQSDVMSVTLGEWGQEERPGGRDATAFEKENPNILMLNANGSGEFQDM